MEWKVLSYRREGRACRGRALALCPALAAGAFAAVLCAVPARAELVILTDGNVMKVKAFEVAGEQASLSFLGGGRMTLPIERVERVVDDEVEPRPPVAPAALAASAAPPAVPAPSIPLHFDASQAVPEGPFGGLLYEAAKRHSVNPRLLKAVVDAESAGHATAISRVGARGLMQLMPATAERFGIAKGDLFLPAQNIEAGSRYLAWLLEQFPNDLPKVLAAYNAGENAVQRYGGVPPYRETRNYVRRIFSILGLSLSGTLGP
ncbi:MAG TPA: lytic transglycosylase domain-containing protein [Thermoanaerobaculia bacterium]